LFLTLADIFKEEEVLDMKDKAATIVHYSQLFVSATVNAIKKETIPIEGSNKVIRTAHIKND
jgi:hypothetical protein